ncbi:DUF7716 domain-containing protein [Paenibacillus puerhi]|uniref:DUF7716 domain-containing protein n=1 Tax=Paenibacillus puerhi TaxID=2692622 RepID=UPI00135A0A68|nr:hypothetical protein [Paenibacillus puerhi]
MDKLLKFEEVLLYSNKFSWADSLFLPVSKDWSISSYCAVLNMDDLEDDEELPQFALENNLIYALNMSDVQDMVKNAKEQRPELSVFELFDAFLYYYQNDAFMLFE